MRSKLVTSYYCDFCRKATCSASHTARHERACTMNPNRVCKMCVAAGNEQASRDELAAAWNRDIASTDQDNIGVKRVEPNQLSIAAMGCPACILATIRQETPGDVLPYFDYKSATADFWREVNSEEEDRNDYVPPSGTVINRLYDQ